MVILYGKKYVNAIKMSFNLLKKSTPYDIIIV